MMFNKLKILMLLIPALLISACGDNGSGELTEWMATVKKRN